MQIVVWNSQGAKWDDLWTYYLAPILASSPSEDVIGLVVEAGWSPWVASGDVVLNNVYPLDSTATWHVVPTGVGSQFYAGMTQGRARNRKAFWIPWVKQINASNQNSRCSMGAVTVARAHTIGRGDRFKDNNPSLYYRPTLRIPVTQPTSGGGYTRLTVFLVHLAPGQPTQASAQVSSLIAGMSQLIPEGSGALIVGDFNIDVLNQPAPFVLPAKWSLKRTGVSTQTRGNELDWGLLYDPTGDLANTTVKVLDTYQSTTNNPPGHNLSDHSVLQFSVQLS